MYSMCAISCHLWIKGQLMILLVDDNLDMLEACKSILEDHGYHVRSCSTSNEAIQAFHDHQEEIKIVITDYRMPNMDGLELIQNLRMYQPNIKTILISGDFDRKLPNNITFLQKPFSFEALIQEIKA